MTSGSEVKQEQEDGVFCFFGVFFASRVLHLTAQLELQSTDAPSGTLLLLTIAMLVG